MQRCFFPFGGSVHLWCSSRRCLTSVPARRTPHATRILSSANPSPPSSSVRSSGKSEPRVSSSSSGVFSGGSWDAACSFSSWTTSTRQYSDVQCASERSPLWCDAKDDDDHLGDGEESRHACDISASTSFELEELRQWASTLEKERAPEGPPPRLPTPSPAGVVSLSASPSTPSTTPPVSSTRTPRPHTERALASTSTPIQRARYGTPPYGTTTPMAVPLHPSSTASPPFPTSPPSSSVEGSLPPSTHASPPLSSSRSDPTRTEADGRGHAGRPRRTRLRPCATASPPPPQAPTPTRHSDDGAASSGSVGREEEEGRRTAGRPPGTAPMPRVRRVQRVVERSWEKDDPVGVVHSPPLPPTSRSLPPMALRMHQGGVGSTAVSVASPSTTPATTSFSSSLGLDGLPTTSPFPSIPVPDALLGTPRWVQHDTHRRLSEASPTYVSTAIAYYHRLHSSVVSMGVSVSLSSTLALERRSGEGPPSAPSLPSMGANGVNGRQAEVYPALLAVVWDALAAMHSDALVVLLEYASTAPACTATVGEEEGRGGGSGRPVEADEKDAEAEGGDAAVAEYASSSMPATAFLVLVEALLLRLCERAIELSSKHLVFLTALLPPLLHGVLSRWECREGEGAGALSHRVHAMEKKRRGDAMSRLEHPTATSPPASSFPSSSSWAVITTDVHSAAAHSRRVGQLLHHTLGWCCYVHRASLRRGQNVHCLHALLIAHLLPPPSPFPFAGRGEERRGAAHEEGEEEEEEKATFHPHRNKHKHTTPPVASRKDGGRREGKISSRQGDGLSSVSHASTVMEAASPLSHALSHLLFRCITSKEEDSVADTISAHAITYLPQAVLTHGWRVLFPIVRSAALLWVQKHKVRQKLSSPSGGGGGGASPLFLSALPPFLDRVRPSQPPREIFSRLTRAVQESQHWCGVEWDRAFLRCLHGATRSHHAVRHSHDPSVPSRREEKEGGGGGGRRPFGIALYSHGFLPCQTRAVSLPSVEAPPPPHLSSSSSWSAMTENRIRSALERLLVLRGEDFLCQLSFLQEKLLPLHPYPSLFATTARDHPSLPLSTVLVHHMLFREWPRVVSAPRRASLAEEEEEMEKPTLVCPTTLAPPSSSSSSLDVGAPVTSFSSPLSVSHAIPLPGECHTQRLVRGLWLLLRRVNVLEATRDVLWMLPALARVEVEVEEKEEEERKGEKEEEGPMASTASLLDATPSSSFPILEEEAKVGTPPPPPPSALPFRDGNAPSSSFVIPVEVMAVIRCVVAHIPPSLVRVVLQQVIDTRAMAALPIHPFVLHFLVVLLRGHHRRSVSTLDSGVDGGRRPEGRKNDFSSAAKAADDDEDAYVHRRRQEKGHSAAALEAMRKVPSASPPMAHRTTGKDDVQRVSTPMERKQRPLLPSSPRHGMMRGAELPQEDAARAIQEVIHTLAQESLVHNAFYARRNAAHAAHDQRTGQKEEKEVEKEEDLERCKGGKVSHQWWWTSKAYDSLWQQVEQVAVPPSSFFSLASSATTTTEEWCLAEEEEEEESGAERKTEEGVAFSDDPSFERSLSFVDPLQGDRATDKMEDMLLPLFSTPLFSPPSSALGSGTAEAMPSTAPHLLSTTFPVSSCCQVAEANEPNDKERKKGERAVEGEVATPIPAAAEVSICSHSSLERMTELDRWRYWNSISRLVNHPEVDVRLCSVMATMQRKLLLLLHRRQRSKMWIMEHD